MGKGPRWASLALVMGLMVTAVVMRKEPRSKAALRIGIPAHWGELSPPLQNSVYGGVVLPNQFETLIRRGANGLIEPLAAASWTVSPDHRVVRFTIDGKRRFSDGSPLTAADFKRSWEDGLRMRARAKNRSVEDALYSLKGFDAFARKGTIDGIRVLGDRVLQLDFTEPARIPLGYLSGVRYAAYKLVGGRAIGTGSYVMEEVSKTLLLTPNAYYANRKPAFPVIKIMEVPTEAVPKALESGEIDGSLFVEKADLPGCNATSGRIRCVYSQESDHVAVKVNGLPGRLFAETQYRLALQTLVHDRLASAGPSLAIRSSHFVVDPQSFLRFQAGRLPDAEARRLVEAGRRYIPSLVAASRRRPVCLVYASGWQWLAALLRDAGVAVSEDSGPRLFPEILDIIYRTHAADLVPGGFSVYNGDPDGLYHLLGRRGAIFSNMMDRPGVAVLMESGRRLTDPGRLPAHYEKAARAILKEVPYVHLGYDCRAVAYDSRKLKVAEGFISRNDHSVNLFEPR